MAALPALPAARLPAQNRKNVQCRARLRCYARRPDRTRARARHPPCKPETVSSPSPSSASGASTSL
ncbi:hypothetical protein CBM2586_A10035 [Cupriavidus phytorum]|uniref:Uncharacterized protein n=1 Tax=Cupriavidus taiwanensis TaxID=164546 RepID=A0A375B8Z1_9BURK|nr:hypothetical protein CBM2586_A10035 [Cupriavidus taiwanensis]